MMQNRIPLPTDNIYKFYALFGVLILIFSFGSSIYLNNSTNDLAFDIAVEFDTLKADPARTLEQETRFHVLQKKLEIAQANKTTFLFCLGLLGGISLIMISYGFKKWHTEVQPIQDEIARLSLKKLKRELGEDD